ncbi:MAG: BMP family ABC transporter substrate-binding protein, partial [Lachnospiraceae bacterium]|nr:BMP family ABC transporter substrate-binding protein [Lachnospiraceae bacterium]
MKKQKRITMLALSLLLGSMTVLSACSSSSHNTADAPAPSGISPNVADSVQSKKVALITSSGGLEDESFNQSAWEGLQRTSGTYGCSEIYIETRSGTVFSDNLDKAISEGADLCWGIGYSCAEDMLKAANDHPDISFGVIDNYFDNTPANMTGIMFRAQESSFLVGYIAGCVTESEKVGFVGGVPGEIMDQFQYGYQAGVAYAAKESGKEVLVDAVYADTY